MPFDSLTDYRSSVVDNCNSVKLLCGDVLPILAGLPSDSVDLVVTSPPYNFGIPYDNHDDRMPENKYWAWLESVWSGVYRVTKPCGRICVNGPLEQPSSGLWIAKCWDTLRNAGWNYMFVITWLKSIKAACHAWGSFASPSNPYGRNPEEMILVAYKGERKNPANGRLPIITPQEFIKYTSGVWNDVYVDTSRDAKRHPAAFPKELPERCIKLLAYRGDTVLDPFCGIGTTGMASVACGCKFIGIDISPKYVGIAKERIYWELIKKEP